MIVKDKLKVGQTRLYMMSVYNEVKEYIVTYYQDDPVDGDYFGMMDIDVYNLLPKEQQNNNEYLVFHSICISVGQDYGVFYTPKEAIQEQIDKKQQQIDELKKLMKQY